MDPELLIEKLGLEPHPEGGWYSETYRAAGYIPRAALPGYTGDRSHATAIYYLLRDKERSALHRIASDEIFHFYAGDPVEMFQLGPDGRGQELIIGPRVDRGQRPQVVVPGGVWQGLTLVDGGRFALLGCTVAPGFDFADFEIADAGALAAAHPRWANRIQSLARCDTNKS
jgi:predicted cupin superfamily sugar epimerase